MKTGILNLATEDEWRPKNALCRGDGGGGAGLKDAVAAGKWWMAWAQLSSQSMGVLRFGPCDGAMTLPSGPIAGSRSGREGLVSAAVAPGGASSPPLRPHPARPSAATSVPIAAIRTRRRSNKGLNSSTPQSPTA